MVTAEASRWRYSRVPAGKLRIIQPSYTMGKAGWEDGAGGTRNRHLLMQREMPAVVEMLMVSAATRLAMRSSTKRPVSSIKVDTPPPSGGTTTSKVWDSEGERNLNSEKSRLKAGGVQEEPKGIPLLATSGHVGKELPLAEERRGVAISILESMEQRRTECGARLRSAAARRASGCRRWQVAVGTAGSAKEGY